MTEKKNNEELIASEAESATSYYGVLSGLSFTASILIFSFRASLPFSEFFLTLSLITTILFIYACTLSANANGALSDGRIDDAKRQLDLSDDFGITGFFSMLSEIAFIAFCTGWQYGTVIIAVEVVGFAIFYKYS
ncbi:hypothetical protein MUP77_00220 [Candidatus Bathyarchaeota archaeon]|nr:hypothetical protein [Candidatus Bathyarchaeota archaeon]